MRGEKQDGLQNREGRRAGGHSHADLLPVEELRPVRATYQDTRRRPASPHGQPEMVEMNVPPKYKT